MGSSRESRESEKSFNGANAEMRSIDKLLWNGNRYSLRDIEEGVDLVKNFLDQAVLKFKSEIKEDKVK